MILTFAAVVWEIAQWVVRLNRLCHSCAKVGAVYLVLLWRLSTQMSRWVPSCTVPDIWRTATGQG
jgi:hypothetical protein